MGGFGKKVQMSRSVHITWGVGRLQGWGGFPTERQRSEGARAVGARPVGARGGRAGWEVG